MSPIVKTASIPHLTSLRNSLPARNASLEVLHATEEQLAQLSEETLARLSDRVQSLAVPEPEPAAVPEEPKPDAIPVHAVPVDAVPVPEDDQVSETIRNVVGQVLERSNSSVPVVLLFVGSEPNEHVDEVSARVASALCGQTESRVLLIDSDNVGKNLTMASRRLTDSGMTEIIEYNQDWRSHLLRNQHSNLDFLPVGNGSFGRWNQKELLRKAVCDMKTEYQFVCVAGGDAHGLAAKLWSDICDGSYLLVSVKNTNGTIAKSAVTELKSSGARLLGCIVTDANEA